MQGPGVLAAHALVIGGLRLTQRVVAVKKGPGLHVALDLRDAVEAVGHQLLGRDAAFANAGRGLGEVQCG